MKPVRVCSRVMWGRDHEVQIELGPSQGMGRSVEVEGVVAADGSNWCLSIQRANI